MTAYFRQTFELMDTALIEKAHSSYCVMMPLRSTSMARKYTATKTFTNRKAHHHGDQFDRERVRLRDEPRSTALNFRRGETSLRLRCINRAYQFRFEFCALGQAHLIPGNLVTVTVEKWQKSEIIYNFNVTENEFEVISARNSKKRTF